MSDEIKNEITEDIEFDSDATSDDLEVSHNAKNYTYSDVQQVNTNIFSDGITKTTLMTDLQKWLKNPDTYQENIQKLIHYQYITNSSVFQLFDTAFAMPTLNYKMDVDSYDDNDYEDVKQIRKTCTSALKHLKYRTTTRALLNQTASTGTFCGAIIGTKKKPIIYFFDDLQYIFPAYPRNNTWAIWIDLAWFDTMNRVQREAQLKSLKSIVSESDYKKYKEDPQSYRYIEIPDERSICLHSHKLYNNQRFGLPWGTQTLLDSLHKEKLKNLEKAVANKVINSVAVLTLGDGSKDSNYHDSKIKNQKKKVVNGIKKGLVANSEGKTPIIAIPHWSTLDFVNPDVDGLDAGKFTSINNDLNMANNGLDGIYGGNTNFSSGKLTIDILYRKVGVLLEQIEEEVYIKLFNWILNNKYKDTISIVFDKSTPLTTKEKIATLEKLNSTFGFSLKAVIDLIDDVDYETYLQDTFREQEQMNLRDRVHPYESAHTSTSDEETGAPESDNLSDEGEKTKTNGGNNLPTS